MSEPLEAPRGVAVCSRMRFKLATLMVWSMGCGESGPGGGGELADAPRPGNYGAVSIQSYDAMNTPGTATRGGSASAAFFTDAAACTRTQVSGPCDVLQCDFQATPAQVSAGAITFTGALQPITLTPGANQAYPQLVVMQPLFTGGSTVTMSAAGAAVPAFTASLTMPAKATITSPFEPSAGSPYLMIDRTRDFTATWTGGGDQRLQVALDGPSATSRLICRFDASAGRGTIPASTLALLPAGQGGFSMAAISTTEVFAGDWAVEATGYFNAVWPDGSIVSGPTMAQ